MATVRIGYATTFPYPAPTVFAAISDVDKEPEWQDDVIRVWHEPGGPLGVGTVVGRERKIMGKPTVSFGEVVTLIPSSRLEVREQANTGQSPFRVSYELTAVDPGSTGLAFSLAISDVPAAFAPVVRHRLGSTIPTQFKRLQELMAR